MMMNVNKNANMGLEEEQLASAGLFSMTSKVYTHTDARKHTVKVLLRHAGSECGFLGGAERLQEEEGLL